MNIIHRILIKFNISTYTTLQCCFELHFLSTQICTYTHFAFCSKIFLNSISDNQHILTSTPHISLLLTYPFIQLYTYNWNHKTNLFTIIYIARVSKKVKGHLRNQNPFKISF